MNDDYLWDRTGEPDPEIQELEEVLGTLRYQLQPLELPAGIRPEQQRRYFPLLAIAAAIALLILAAGLWVRIQRSQTSGENQMVNGPQPGAGQKQVPAITPTPLTPGPGHEQLAGAVDKETPGGIIRNRKRSPKNFAARNGNRPRAAVEPAAGLTAEQREEAVAAKEQLMLALRLASAKLNFAQRKTQGSPQGPIPNTIRNQHKVG